MKQVDHLAVDNFKQVKDEFNNTLFDTGDQLGVTFEEIKDQIKFEELVAIVNSIVNVTLNFNTDVLGNVKNEVEIVQKNVSEIQSQVSNILVGNVAQMCQHQIF